MSAVVLPALGEEIEKAVVAFWHCKVGQQVNEGDDLVELVTDKASFNVPAHTSGILEQILVKEGQEAKIGQALAVIA